MILHVVLGSERLGILNNVYKVRPERWLFRCCRWDEDDFRGGRGGRSCLEMMNLAIQVAPKCKNGTWEKWRPPKNLSSNINISWNLWASWASQIPPFTCYSTSWKSRQQLPTCLWPGTWLVLLGASQSSVWLQQLANTLVPGAFNALRDNFVTDGREGSDWGKMLELFNGGSWCRKNVKKPLWYWGSDLELPGWGIFLPNEELKNPRILKSQGSFRYIIEEKKV